MYDPIPADRISDEGEVIKIVGQDNVDRVLKINCEPTGRVIDNCYNVVEFSASLPCETLKGDEVHLVVYYLESKDDVEYADDLGMLDWDDYSFEIV